FNEPREKQYNVPQISQGTWRLGRLSGPLERGRFAVFRAPGGGGPRVGRVVATEGQRVEVTETDVLVDGQPFTDPAIHPGSTRIDMPELVVPRGCVFVVCDLRGAPGAAENDGRLLGPIPVEAVTHSFAPLENVRDR